MHLTSPGRPPSPWVFPNPPHLLLSSHHGYHRCQALAQLIPIDNQRCSRNNLLAPKTEYLSGKGIGGISRPQATNFTLKLNIFGQVFMRYFNTYMAGLC